MHGPSALEPSHSLALAGPMPTGSSRRCTSRAEPGNVFYQAQVNPEDPETFFLYEQYTDAQAYEDHKATPYFQENVFGYILEYLAERSVKTYETIDA